MSSGLGEPGKKVLITGASSGIGEATAYAFSRDQCELFLVARRQDRLAQVAKACRKKGASKVINRHHDLSVPGEGRTIVQECLDGLGNLDILVCNAGYGMYAAVWEIPPEDMQRIWQVNFQSGYESIYAALPHLLEQKSGHIVLVSSVIGKKALSYYAHYCATKFAQIALGEALWGECKGTGVSVSVVCPGSTATEFGQSAQRSETMRSLQPSRKRQSPDVVAQAIVGAVRHKRREVLLTRSGRALVFMNRIFPGLTAQVMAWGIKRRL